MALRRVLRSFSIPVYTYPIGSIYGIYTYTYHTNQLNVGKYTSPMDPMGIDPVAVANVGIPYYKLCNDPGGHC